MAAVDLPARPGLVLAGALGPEAERVREVGEAAGLRPVFTDRVDDPTLAALYRGAGVVVVPSRHEGFGLPMLEAMASGAAVVGTRAGNLSDLAGGAAILVPPGDVAQLAQAIHDLLAYPPRAAARGQAGRAVASGFSWAATAEATVAVYRAVLSRDGN
jgi:glycosyltransferase involved in cell wall biosynthesis